MSEIEESTAQMLIMGQTKNSKEGKQS